MTNFYFELLFPTQSTNLVAEESSQIKPAVQMQIICFIILKEKRVSKTWNTVFQH